jgi:rhomboid family GlyGly-CTERM serine protease
MQHFKTYIPVSLISILSFMATFINAQTYNFLRYDRDAILDGEFWRILTGNLTHAGMGHWLVNIVGLWIIWFLYVTNPQQANRMLIVIATTAIGTCLGIIIFESQLMWYVGLSGALHGLLTAGIVITFKSDKKMQFVLAILLCAKLVYEQILGPLPGSEKTTTVPVIVNSHLYGAISGVVVGIIILFYKKPLYKASN